MVVVVARVVVCCVCVSELTSQDLERPRFHHIWDAISPQKGSAEFECHSHVSPVFSKHCVCASDPLQWEASSCFCCPLRNSITLNSNKQSSGTHRSSDQARPQPLKFVGFPRRRCALKWSRFSLLERLCSGFYQHNWIFMLESTSGISNRPQIFLKSSEPCCQYFVFFYKLKNGARYFQLLPNQHSLF